MNNVKDALTDLKKVVELSPNDKIAALDKEMIALLCDSLGSETEREKFEAGLKGVQKILNFEKNEKYREQLHSSSLRYRHA